jgi:hypothetical protein
MDSLNNKSGRSAWIWAAVIIIFAGSVIFIYHLFFRNTIFTGKEKTVAVLPFVNLGADTSEEYLSDGMTDEIIDRLSKINGLRVVARSSVMKYKGHEQDLNKICRFGEIYLE